MRASTSSAVRPLVAHALEKAEAEIARYAEPVVEGPVAELGELTFRQLPASLRPAAE